MLQSNAPLHLGVIICKHCNAMVDTLSTNKVRTYHGVCDECREQHRGTDSMFAGSGPLGKGLDKGNGSD